MDLETKKLIITVIYLLLLIAGTIYLYYYYKKMSKKNNEEKEEMKKVLYGTLGNTESLIYMLGVMDREHTELLLINIKNQEKGKENNGTNKSY